MPHPGPKGRCSVNIPQLILSIVDVAAAIFLIAVVLLQSGKSAGLSGAIAGVADTFMAKNRAKTWDAKLAKLTKQEKSWILYDVGNDFITIYQPGRERYIVTDIYALKYIEFYDTRRREQCEAMLKQNGLWDRR